MASSTTKLMTFAEFERLPDPPGGLRYELRHGEPVTVPPPKIEHSRVQWRIRRLLESAAGAAGIVDKEIGFRPRREYEWRVADVAFVSKARWDLAEDYWEGAPEIVVEVLSPSNSATEMIEGSGCAWKTAARNSGSSIRTCKSSAFRRPTAAPSRTAPARIFRCLY